MPTQQHTQTGEERTAQVQALTERLNNAVAGLVSGDAWQAMLRMAARFHRYPFRNVMLLWAQAEDREMQLSQVAGYRSWQSVGRQVRKGEKALRVLAPVRRRLSAEEAAERAAHGEPAYDAEGRPVRVVRGFRLESVFDIFQTDGDELPRADQPQWLSGPAPARLWDALAELVAAEGYRLERNPEHGDAHGWTDHGDRVVSVRPDLEEAQAVATLAHELGHIRAGHDDRPIGRRQRETEADSITYVVCCAHGLDPTAAATPYAASWSNGDPKILQAAAETVHRTAVEILADLDGLFDDALEVERPNLRRSHTRPAQPLARRECGSLRSGTSVAIHSSTCAAPQSQG